MSEGILKIANESGLWIISLSIVAVVLVQSILYVRLSFKVAPQIGYPTDKCKLAFRSGMIAAIGSSISIFIVMVGMMSVVGAPITWLRLSIIGSATTELTASTLGAKAVGVEFGSAQYDVTALSASFWTMAINGTGWLLFTALFTHKLEDIRSKAGGGDARWLAVLSSAAALGCYGYLNANTVNGVIAAVKAGKNQPYGPLFAALGGLLGMFFLSKVAQKNTWMREYLLGFALLIGMAAGALLGPLF